MQSDRLPAAGLDAVPDLLAVLDTEREVVFSNQAYHCVTVRPSREGCGTSEACAAGGAAGAVDESLRTGSPATRDLTTHSLPFEIAAEVGEGCTDLLAKSRG